MSNLHEEVLPPKHSGLLHEINQTIIAAKIWYGINQDHEKPELLDQAKAHNPPPDWDAVIKLLGKCRDAIMEQKIDLKRKY